MIINANWDGIAAIWKVLRYVIVFVSLLHIKLYTEFALEIVGELLELGRSFFILSPHIQHKVEVCIKLSASPVARPTACELALKKWDKLLSLFCSVADFFYISPVIFRFFSADTVNGISTVAFSHPALNE